MELIPPKYFEGNTYIIKLHFSTLTDLQDHKDKLDEIIHNPVLNKIILY